MNKNNGGYTLVELMVSMIITAIVVSIIISFIAANSDSYRYASETLKLQMEAQTVTDQICDMVLEADWIKAVDINSNEKGIIVYHKSIADMLLLNRSDEKLYLLEKLTQAELSDYSLLTYSQEENLMAFNISDITINPEDEVDILNHKEISLTMIFTEGSQSLAVERNIKFRNKLIIPAGL